MRLPHGFGGGALRTAQEIGKDGALADEDRDPREDAMIRVTADLLGVSDRDRAIARQRTERKDG